MTRGEAVALGALGGLGVLALAGLVHAATKDEQPLLRPPLLRRAGYLVRNVAGTSGRLCLCGSWRNHFELNTTGPVPTQCSVVGCQFPMEVGAHVHLFATGSREQFIVPMCKGCNNSTSLLLVDDDVRPVSANTQLMGCYRG